MYPPKHFVETDMKQLHVLVKRFPLAIILMPNIHSDLNNVCHVPVLYDDIKKVFIAHVAKQNPLSQLHNTQVQLLFNGDNSYLSPSYSGNKTLPSWLYTSALIRAKVCIVKSEEQKEKIMRALTTHFEQGFEPMWNINELPKAKREIMYQKLSFIEFSPLHWQGNYKLSQNKPAKVRDKIKQSLIRANKNTLAELF